MNPSPFPTQKCPRCQADLPADSVAGLCPRCLMLGAMQPTQDGDPGTTMPAPALEEFAAQFPQLEIIELLGRGGMGVVYKARQKALGRLVALKLLAPERVGDPKFAERFVHEAKALAALSHPNIVTIHDFGQAGGFFFLLMEFVDGVNLRQAMRAGRFTPEQALAIVPPVCEALQFAHEHGIVHRDIKPENLLLDKAGRVKIADFGIAKMLGQETSEQAGGFAPQGEGTLASAAGTPQYMAPEQKAQRPSDHRADIYSLGVVLYELLTGELPADKLQPPSRKVQIDVRLDEIVLRALEQTPELRYQTAGEFRTRVEAAVAATEHATPTDQRPPRFSRTAMIGAFWIPFVLAAAGFITFEPHPARIPFPYDLTFTASLLLFGSLAGFFGTTILGWVAVTQIRHSAGKLLGLWLAVFDGLFFPLLALDALIVAADLSGRTHLTGPSMTPGVLMAARNIPGPVIALLLTILVVVDALIIRWVWRAVSKPPASSGNPGAATPPQANVAMLLAGLSAVLGGLLFSRVLTPSPMVVFGILVASLLAIVLAIPLRHHPRVKPILWIGAFNAALWMIVAAGGIGTRLNTPTALSAAPEAVEAYAFGPVIERVIAVGNEPNTFYSVNRGDFVPGPADLGKFPDASDQRLWGWLATNDVDFFAHQSHGGPLLAMSDLITADCREADFDRMTPGDLVRNPTIHEQAGKGLRSNFSSPLNGFIGEKITMAFQTRYQRFGMVQVLGVNSEPPGVKIRYKLLVSAVDPKAPLVFGPEANGLQAAVEVTPGEPFGLRFHIRNASNHQFIVAGRNYRQHDECIVEDGEGHRLAVTGSTRMIRSFTQRSSFRPGETIAFESGGLSFHPGSEINYSYLASYHVQAKPGRYTLRFKLQLPDADSPDKPEVGDWQGLLETGPVTVEFKGPGAAAGKQTAAASPASVSATPPGQLTPNTKALRTDVATLLGPESGGLRAAVILHTADHTDYRIGKPIEVEFHVLNVSKANIFLGGSSWRQERAEALTITDEKGQAMKTEHIWYSGETPYQRNLLKPGETAVVHSSGLAFLPDDADTSKAGHPVGNVVRGKPGRYAVKFRLHFPDVDETFPQPADWKGDLETAPVEIEVKEAVAPKTAATPGAEEAGGHPDLKNLVGEWEVVSVKGQGTFRWRNVSVGDRLPITSVKLQLGAEQEMSKDYYAISPTKNPKEFDVRHWVKNLFATQRGIYRLDGDTLTLCVGPYKEARPASFDAEAEESTIIVAKRIAPAKAGASAEEAARQALAGKAKAAARVAGEVTASGLLEPAKGGIAPGWVCRATVAEVDIHKVSAGQGVTMTLTAFPPRAFHGRVSRVSDKALQLSDVVVFETDIELTDSDPAFKEGVTVNVIFDTPPSPAGLTEEQLAQLDVLLKEAPVTTDPKAALLENDGSAPRSYRWRNDLVIRDIVPVTKPGETAIPRGQILSLPDGSFYVQWDLLGVSTHHYYGPFSPNSKVAVQLGLAP